MQRRFSPGALLFQIAVVTIALLVPSQCDFAWAQERNPPASAASSVILGTVAGERGSTASIPVYYEPGKNTRLLSLHVEVDFVSNSVKFTKADKGLAAQNQDYDISAEAKELPPDDKKIIHTRLHLDFTASGSDPKKSLPEGLLTFLNFNIPMEAKPFSISLKPITITAEDTSKKPVKVAGEAGKIIVSDPDVPLVGCFFFSH